MHTFSSPWLFNFIWHLRIDLPDCCCLVHIHHAKRFFFFWLDSSFQAPIPGLQLSKCSIWQPLSYSSTESKFPLCMQSRQTAVMIWHPPACMGTAGWWSQRHCCFHSPTFKIWPQGAEEVGLAWKVLSCCCNSFALAWILSCVWCQCETLVNVTHCSSTDKTHCWHRH